jgi:cyclophilin family peptidyl-prolyl cis-trans isomerase
LCLLRFQGHHALKGTSIHKLQRHFAAFGGLSSRTAAATASSTRSNLQHIDPGLLSVHKDGSHFAITLGRALKLDDDYCVIGRTGKGLEVLDKLSDDVTMDREEAPEVPLVIAQCGTTDHRGMNETLSAAAGTSGGAAADAIEAAKEQSQHVSAGVAEALLEGLKKRAIATPAPGLDALRQKKQKQSIAGLSDSDSDESDGE